MSKVVTIERRFHHCNGCGHEWPEIHPDTCPSCAPPSAEAMNQCNSMSPKLDAAKELENFGRYLQIRCSNETIDANKRGLLGDSMMALFNALPRHLSEKATEALIHLIDCAKTSEEE